MSSILASGLTIWRHLWHNDIEFQWVCISIVNKNMFRDSALPVPTSRGYYWCAHNRGSQPRMSLFIEGEMCRGVLQFKVLPEKRLEVLNQFSLAKELIRPLGNDRRPHALVLQALATEHLGSSQPVSLRAAVDLEPPAVLM
eukprot:1376471-Pyramimonas_sp.AAC.1